MKKITMCLGVVIMAMTSLFAQYEPKFEKKGDRVMATYYTDNGSVQQYGTFKGEEQDGQWVMLDDQGNIMVNAFYQNGKKEGKWFIYADDGKTLYEVVYENDLLIDSSKWTIEERNLLADK